MTSFAQKFEQSIVELVYESFRPERGEHELALFIDAGAKCHVATTWRRDEETAPCDVLMIEFSDQTVVLCVVGMNVICSGELPG